MQLNIPESSLGHLDIVDRWALDECSTETGEHGEMFLQCKISDIMKNTLSDADRMNK